MLSEIELAWAAGFFDGEGSVGISFHSTMRSGKRYRNHVLRVAVLNTHLQSILLFQTMFGGKVYRRKLTGMGKRQVWCWQAGSLKAIRFLESVQPYLKVKASHAIFAIAFQKSKRFGAATTHVRQRVPINIVVHREVLRRSIQALNHGTYSHPPIASNN